MAGSSDAIAELAVSLAPISAWLDCLGFALVLALVFLPMAPAVFLLASTPRPVKA